MPLDHKADSDRRQAAAGLRFLDFHPRRRYQARGKQIVQRLMNVDGGIFRSGNDLQHRFEFSLVGRVSRCAFKNNFDCADRTAFVVADLSERSRAKKKQNERDAKSEPAKP